MRYVGFRPPIPGALEKWFVDHPNSAECLAYQEKLKILREGYIVLKHADHAEMGALKAVLHNAGVPFLLGPFVATKRDLGTMHTENGQSEYYPEWAILVIRCIREGNNTSFTIGHEIACHRVLKAEKDNDEFKEEIRAAYKLRSYAGVAFALRQRGYDYGRRWFTTKEV